MPMMARSVALALALLTASGAEYQSVHPNTVIVVTDTGASKLSRAKDQNARGLPSESLAREKANQLASRGNRGQKLVPLHDAVCLLQQRDDALNSGQGRNDIGLVARGGGGDHASQEKEEEVDTDEEDEEEQEEEEEADPTSSASAAIKAMGVGINLGQKFESKSNDYLGDPTALIDSIAGAGFDHIRIPVTWGDHMWKKGGDFVNRVTKAVKHSLSKGLWVMINTHHEFDWLKDVYEGQKWIDDKFWKLWVDIANHFKDCSNKLVFEVLNEPEHKFGSHNGHYLKPGDPWGIQKTRKINNLGYEAIRSVSKDRIIMVSPNAQGNSHQLIPVYGNKGDLPKGGNDQFLAVSVHTYDPWECCGEDGHNDNCGEAPKVNFDEIGNWMKTTGIPVHWGEFGIGRKHQHDQWQREQPVVRNYYTKIVSETLKRDMSPCVWDDQGWFRVSQGDGEWVLGIKDAIMLGKSGGGGGGDCAKKCYLNGVDSSCKSRVKWVMNNMHKNLQDSVGQVNGECGGQCSCTEETYKGKEPGRRRRRRRRRRRKTSGGGGGGVGGEPVEHPTAAEAVEQMGIGINIGNRYDLPKAHPVNKGTDAPDYDAKSHIDFIKEGGFKHVRIPVTWGMHFWERPNQLKRVTEAVEHALNQGLWVMINTHHEFWLKDQYNGQTWLDDKFRELWSKIADHFKASSNKLVFEVLNEPEHNFGGNPPHCTPGEVCHDQVFAHDQQAIDRTRRINQVGYEAIRSVSKTRVVFVSPNSQGNHALLRTVYPKKADLPSGGSDKQLAVTVHSYDPWDCCGPEGDNSKCSASKDQGWKGMPDFDDLQKWSKNEGIPLHLGEYGVGRSFDSGKDHQRGEKIVNDVYWKVTRDALQRGISACAWDDHGDFATADGRYKNNEWQHNIKDVIMDAVKNAGK